MLESTTEKILNAKRADSSNANNVEGNFEDANNNQDSSNKELDDNAENTDVQDTEIKDEVENTEVVEQQETSVEQKIVLTEEEIRNSILKELGVSNIEEAKQKLSPKVELTPEQIESDKIQRDAEIAKIAVRKGLNSVDVLQIKELKEKDAKEIVWNDFKNKKKQELKEDYDEEDVLLDFEDLYNIGAGGEKKDMGEKMLEIQKQNLIKDKLDILVDAEKEYEKNIKLEPLSKKYDNEINKAVDAIENEMKFTVNGDTITLKTEKFNKEELRREMLDNKVLMEQMISNEEGFGGLLQDFIKTKIQKENFDTILSLVHEAAKSKTIKNDLAGLKAPFEGNTEQQKSGLNLTSDGLKRTKTLVSETLR